jgi:hypothetical protein
VSAKLAKEVSQFLNGHSTLKNGLERLLERLVIPIIIDRRADRRDEEVKRAQIAHLQPGLAQGSDHLAVDDRRTVIIFLSSDETPLVDTDLLIAVA